jgi:transposase
MRDRYYLWAWTRGPQDASITLAFCWSHVRRGFYDLAKSKAPIAVETLKRIAALYDVEERVRGKSAADRLASR